MTETKRDRAASWLLLSVLVVLADQASKYYITQHFGEFEHITLLPVLDVTRMHNVGAAFSFLASASGWQRWVFIGLAGIVSVGIIVWIEGASARIAALRAGAGAGRCPRQRHRPYSIRICHRFHTLSLGSSVFSGL